MADFRPIVAIENGKLQGTTKVDWLGKNYISFQGIPYAKPPVGNLRFKDPQPPNSWQGIHDATKEGCDCFSRDFVTKQWHGSEDCLFLNVYTPKLPTKDCKLKAVMLWIHGGGFVLGSGSTQMYGPDFLVSEDVVLVTINYRIGLLGFANFCDPLLQIPGNAGLKDQVMALRWVQKNISAFGGNPNNVTIFGESAGGASVHFLMLSPLAKGLFHKGIMQSGVATAVWARSSPTAPHVAKALGLKNVSEAEIVRILMEYTVEQLLEVQENIQDVMLSQSRTIGPVVESVSGEHAFLSCDPDVLVSSGKISYVPLMIGYTSREGILIDFINMFPVSLNTNQCGSQYEDFVPFYLGASKDHNKLKNVNDKICGYYYGNSTASEENKDKSFLLYTDVYFFIPINNVVRAQTKFSPYPTYYYRMSVQTQLNSGKIAGIASSRYSGVAHADDNSYLFKNQFTPDIQPNTAEDVAVRRFIKLWTTFAKNGNPNSPEKDELINITWPPAKSNKLYFLDIGDNLTVGVDPELERVKFWDKIHDLLFSD